MKNGTHIMITAAFLAVGAANAQQWVFVDGPQPTIQNSGWVFEVSVENGNELTLTKCIGSPPYVTGLALPLGSSFTEDYKIVGINGVNQAGGILGTHRDKADSLTLPDSLTNIGDYAFNDCPALTGGLTLPNAVTNIGVHAFQWCGFTGTLIIPDTVTNIGNDAFSFNTFTEIFTPSEGVSFGDYVFADNPPLKAVRYSGGYPASVGAYHYFSSTTVTSYVAAANAQSWDPYVSPANTLSTTGAAIWQGYPIRCSTLVVSFDGNGATNGPFSVQAAIQGEPYGTLPEAAKPGYTADWTLDDATVTAASIVTATTNHTLVAQWTANTYRLAFAPGDALPYNPSRYTQDVTYDTLTALLPNAYVYPGHTFAGWLCAADNHIYRDGVTVLNLAVSGRVGMVAQWAPIGFLGEGVLIGSITVDIGGDVTLTWPPVKCNAYAVYVTDDLAAPPEAWAAFVEGVEANLYITRGTLDSAMLPLKLFKGADLNTDRLFFAVRVLN
ncbi:MAG: leucine-rich repeat protein [Kiritimatiellaeota bacterium]|nr:leucine-rich repeat protein [Kiritimatiellota bacterium]